MSSISLSFVSFVNYFLIPIIGLKIYSERYQRPCNMSFDTLYRYVLITVLNIPFTRIFVNMIEGLLNNNINSESSVYTIVAALSVMILTYVLEVVDKLITVEIEIKKKDTDNTKDKDEDEEINS